MDHPVVRDAISRLALDSVYGTENDAKEIFHVKDDHAFVWSRKDSNLLVVSLSNAETQGNKEGNGLVQTISLTDSPVFEVERISSSLSGEITFSLVSSAI